MKANIPWSILMLAMAFLGWAGCSTSSEQILWDKRRAQSQRQESLAQGIDEQLKEIGGLGVQVTELRRRERQLKSFVRMEEHELEVQKKAHADYVEAVRLEEEMELQRLINRPRYNEICIRELNPDRSKVRLATGRRPKWTLVVDLHRPLVRNCVLRGVDFSVLGEPGALSGIYVVILTPVWKMNANERPTQTVLSTMRQNVTAMEALLSQRKGRLEALSMNVFVQKNEVEEARQQMLEVSRMSLQARMLFYETKNAETLFPRDFERPMADLWRRPSMSVNAEGSFVVRGATVFRLKDSGRIGISVAGPFMAQSLDISRASFSNEVIGLVGDYIGFIVPDKAAVRHSIVSAKESGDSYYDVSESWRDEKVTALLPFNSSMPTGLLLELTSKNRLSFQENQGRVSTYTGRRAEFAVYGDYLSTGGAVSSGQ